MKLTAAIVLCILALLVSSCGSRQTAVVQAQTTPDTDATLFKVPQNQMEHLKLAEVRKQVWSPVVRTSGTVDWDADHTTQAITQVSGPISRLLVDTGVLVKAGQPLLYVSSSDAAGAVATYKK